MTTDEPPAKKAAAEGWPGNVAANHLLAASSFRFRELWWGEWLSFILGAALAIWLAIVAPSRISDVVAVVASVVGVVIGAVVAGMAIQAAGFDRAFLKKLREIEKITGDSVPAVSFLQPFLATAVIGIAAVITLPVWGGMTDTANVAARCIVGGLCGGLSFWALTSLIPALGTLIQFVGLLEDSNGE